MDEFLRKLFLALLWRSILIGVLVIAIIIVLYLLFPWEHLSSQVSQPSTIYLPLITSNPDPRHGVGLAAIGCEALEKLHIGWYYNWGGDSLNCGAAEFIDMIWGVQDMTTTITSRYILGFCDL